MADRRKQIILLIGSRFDEFTSPERRANLGSYPELDKALAGIAHHVNKPLRFAALTLNATEALRLLDEMYVTQVRTEATRFEWSLIDLALAYIDSQMPAEIRVPERVSRREEAA